MIDDSELRNVREALLARARRLVARQRAADRGLGELDSSEAGLDSGPETMPWELFDLMGDTEVRQLQRIRRALERIDLGAYGLCTLCGAAIAEERLRTMPETERCGACSNTH